jgi:hypothetical protein
MVEQFSDDEKLRCLKREITLHAAPLAGSYLGLRR